MIIFTEEQDHSCLNKDLNEQTIEQILDQRDLHNSFDTFKQLGGIHEIIKKLKSDIHMGIDETNQEEVHLRKKFYSKKKKNQFQIIGFLEQIYNEAIQDKIVFLMMASLITKYSFNLVVFEKFWDIIHYFDLIIFMGIYLVQRIVQNYIQQYKLQHKEKVPYQEVSVIRNSVIKQISIKDLLIGDILPLNEGLIIPIDGIIVKGNITISEKLVNGNENLDKNSISPFGYDEQDFQSCIIRSGSVILKGNGIMINLKRRKIKQKEFYKVTPLQLELDDISNQILLWNLIIILSSICIIFPSHNSIIEIVFNFKTDNIQLILNAIIYSCIIILYISLENLPLLVNFYMIFVPIDNDITLTNYQVFEKLAQTNIVILQGRESLQKFKSNIIKCSVMMDGFPIDLDENHIFLNQIKHLICLEESLFYQYKVLNFKLKISVKQESEKIIRIFTFDRFKRFQLFLTQIQSSKFRIIMIGDALQVIKYCTNMMNNENQITLIDQSQWIVKIQNEIQNGYQIIGYAQKIVNNFVPDDNPFFQQENQLQTGLCFLGIVAIKNSYQQKVTELSSELGINLLYLSGSDSNECFQIGKNSGLIMHENQKIEKNDLIMEKLEFIRQSFQQKLIRLRNIRQNADQLQQEYSQLIKKELQDLRIISECDQQGRLNFYSYLSYNQDQIIAIYYKNLLEVQQPNNNIINILRFQTNQFARANTDLIIKDFTQNPILISVNWARQFFFNINAYLVFRIVNQSAIIFANMFLYCVHEKLFSLQQLLLLYLIIEIFGKAVMISQNNCNIPKSYRKLLDCQTSNKIIGQCFQGCSINLIIVLFQSKVLFQLQIFMTLTSMLQNFETLNDLGNLHVFLMGCFMLFLNQILGFDISLSVQENLFILIICIISFNFYPNFNIYDEENPVVFPFKLNFSWISLFRKNKKIQIKKANQFLSKFLLK